MDLNEMKKLYTEASQKYYEDGEIILSDEEFDELENKIRTLSPNDPLLSMTGKGYKLNGIDDKEKFTHPLPMGSIDKEKSVEAVKKWIKSNTTFSTKLDGNSIACYYKEGKLWKVVTRGKDDIGIDRTAKFMCCKNLPKSISDTRYIRVRGEAVILKSDYTIENGFDIKKASRNAVAGAISRQTDWKQVFDFVKFVAYDFRDCETGEIVEGISESFELEEQKSCQEFFDLNVEDFKKKYKTDYRYEADGIVFKTGDDLLAFKFEDETAITKLLDVEWSIGKDQRLVPVAILEPVNLTGATISRASMGSYSRAISISAWPVRKTHFAEIIRANEIIPYVNSTWSEEETIINDMPKCPVCNSESEKNGEHTFCTNPECGNINKSRLLNFCSYFYPEGIGDTVVNKILEAEKVETVFELLELNKATKEVYGVGESHRKMFNEMLSKMSGDIDVKIVYNTFLDSCGDRAAEKIVDSGFDIYKLNPEVDETGNLVVEELLKLNNIPNFNSNIIEDIKRKMLLLSKFLKYRNVIQKKSAASVGTFCITGVRFKGEQLEKIQSLGWKEDSSIKKTTSVLVVKDPNSNSSKTQKAKEYGIKIMNIEQFMEHIS